MWEKLIFLAIIISMISKAQSAVIECSWDPQMTYCSPYNITPLSQQNEAITINGQPSNYVNPNTTYISFYNSIVNYVPSAIFTLFPNIQSIWISNANIQSLSTDLFPNCGHLQYFSVDGGIFTNIPADVVKSCASINSIGFTNGNITTIDVNAFRGLTNLTSINLWSNKITCIPPGLFANLPSLYGIMMDNNKITALDVNAFTNVRRINLYQMYSNSMPISVGLSNNLITSIPLLNLTGSDINFMLGSNPINAITPDFCTLFNGRSSTYSLSFSLYNISCAPIDSTYSFMYPDICANASATYQTCYSNWSPTMAQPVSCGVQPPTTVPPTTVPPTTAVVTTAAPTPGSCPSDKICRYFLDQYNRYTCILDGVDSVLTSISGNHLITFSDPNVRRVVFTNSFLSRIPPILFQKFPSLEYLTVSNCSMSAINTNTFTACGSLKYFDASNNFITTVDGASFKSCAALEVIDLTGNQFDMISGQLFVNNPNLKSVYINRPAAMALV